MCHVFTVSGSSLPVSISIKRWTDHTNLQAEDQNLWHKSAVLYGRTWMDSSNTWEIYQVSLIGLPMPLFQSQGKPNTPSSLCSMWVCHPTASLQCQFFCKSKEKDSHYFVKWFLSVPSWNQEDDCAESLFGKFEWLTKISTIAQQTSMVKVRIFAQQSSHQMYLCRENINSAISSPFL